MMKGEVVHCYSGRVDSGAAYIEFAQASLDFFVLDRVLQTSRFSDIDFAGCLHTHLAQRIIKFMDTEDKGETEHTNQENDEQSQPQPANEDEDEQLKLRIEENRKKALERLNQTRARQMAAAIDPNNNNNNAAHITSTSTSSSSSSEGSFKLINITGDLFSSTDSLVHCISEDIVMGKGIALLFKHKFGGVAELKQQKAKTGGLAFLKRGDRYIYYLITKKKWSDFPTYDSLRASLTALKQNCIKNNVTKLSMPEIGCGLDKLVWYKVEPIIREVFSSTNIQVTVYRLPPRRKLSTCNCKCG